MPGYINRLPPCDARVSSWSHLLFPRYIYASEAETAAGNDPDETEAKAAASNAAEANGSHKGFRGRVHDNLRQGMDESMLELLMWAHRINCEAHQGT